MYLIGEVYPLLVMRPGFVYANGQTLENVDVQYPQLLAWLQDDGPYGGAQFNVSLAEWNAEWNDDAGRWRGQQGACGKYSLDLVAKTIKVMDLRGLTFEFAGYDGLTAGGTHGDMIRNFIATFSVVSGNDVWTAMTGTGACYPTNLNNGSNMRSVPSGSFSNFISNYTGCPIRLDPSRVAPTGAANKPRAFGAHPCLYVGGA
jgi:hypothetical protein